MISTGNSDLCHLSCSRPSHLTQFRENVRRALDLLISLPNILIAVVSPPDPSLIQAALHRPVSCQLLTRTLCPCVTAGAAKSRPEFLADLEAYRAELLRLTSAREYRGRDNARLILLTALHHLQLPPDRGLNLRLLGLPPLSLLPDLSYLAPDCFHPSQKLHAKSNYSIINHINHNNSDIHKLLIITQPFYAVPLTMLTCFYKNFQWRDYSGITSSSQTLHQSVGMKVCGVPPGQSKTSERTRGAGADTRHSE